MTTTVDTDYSDGLPITDEIHGVLLSKQAALKARNLLKSEGRDDLRLRVQVSPGGCSGLIYSLHFDDRVLDGDAITDHDGLELIIDKMSAPYLVGASIDFEDSIAKQGFQINNPNASGSCACGDSFH
jgi:iron-sulfur cluster assembly accessory protein